MRNLLDYAKMLVSVKYSNRYLLGALNVLALEKRMLCELKL